MSPGPMGEQSAAPHLRAAASPANVRELTQEALRIARIDLRQAETVALAACEAAATLDDPTSTGLARRSLANVRYLSGRLDEAVALYDGALEAFALAGDELESAKTRSSALQALILLGRYDQAERHGAAAREVFERRGDAQLLARLDCNLGNLLHRLDRHREALAAYETALLFFREHGGDPQSMAAALLNSAVCLIILGNLSQALERFNEMSAHCRRHDMPLPALQAEYNAAYLHYHRGEYTRAIEVYRDTIERSVEQGDEIHQALCRLDLAEIYLEVNLTAEAAELADSARASFVSLQMRYEASKASTFAAIAAGQRGDLDLAAAEFEEARRGFDAEGNHAWRALVDFHRALVLLEAERPAEARVEAERARDWFDAAGQAPRAALAEVLLARAALALGDLDDARARAQSARARIEKLDRPHLLHRTAFVEGQIAEASGDPTTALARYRDAGEILGDLRTGLHSEELRIAFVKDKQEVYESLIWLTLERLTDATRVEQAFDWVERAKSRAFADLVAPRPLQPRRGNAAAAEIERETRELREELNWCYSQLDAAELAGGSPVPAGDALLGRGAGAVSPEELRRRSRGLEERLVEITQRRRSRDLDFDSLQTGSVVGLEAIRATLPADTVLLEYYEARGTIYAFVLDRDRIEVRAVTTRERVARALGFLQFQLSKLQLSTGYVDVFAEALLSAVRSHLRELHDAVIAPLLPLLRARSLLVVPHGMLHRIPFQALLDGDTYLIDRFALSHAPSASVLQLCASRPVRPSSGAVVLAVPDAHNPGIAAEAGAVVAAMPGARVLLGEDATLEALRGLGAGARLIHVAAHGLFRRDNPMFSAIQLGSSRLTVFDLYELDLAAEVVVLSGCGTGASVVVGGDELIGLVRGLLYAGAQTVIATLWDAHDESTRRFMEILYRLLPAEPDRARALRLAMVELREEYPHPFHWAPFFVAGAPAHG